MRISSLVCILIALIIIHAVCAEKIDGDLSTLKQLEIDYIDEDINEHEIRRNSKFPTGKFEHHVKTLGSGLFPEPQCGWAHQQFEGFISAIEREAYKVFQDPQLRVWFSSAVKRIVSRHINPLNSYAHGKVWSPLVFELRGQANILSKSLTSQFSRLTHTLERTIILDAGDFPGGIIPNPITSGQSICSRIRQLISFQSDRCGRDTKVPKSCQMPLKKFHTLPAPAMVIIIENYELIPEDQMRCLNQMLLRHGRDLRYLQIEYLFRVLKKNINHIVNQLIMARCSAWSPIVILTTANAQRSDPEYALFQGLKKVNLFDAASHMVSIGLPKDSNPTHVNLTSQPVLITHEYKQIVESSNISKSQCNTESKKNIKRLPMPQSVIEVVLPDPTISQVETCIRVRLTWLHAHLLDALPANPISQSLKKRTPNFFGNAIKATFSALTHRKIGKTTVKIIRNTIDTFKGAWKSLFSKPEKPKIEQLKCRKLSFRHSNPYRNASLTSNHSLANTSVHQDISMPQDLIPHGNPCDKVVSYNADISEFESNAKALEALHHLSKLPWEEAVLTWDNKAVGAIMTRMFLPSSWESKTASNKEMRNSLKRRFRDFNLSLLDERSRPSIADYSRLVEPALVPEAWDQRDAAQGCRYVDEAVYAELDKVLRIGESGRVWLKSDLSFEVIDPVECHYYGK